MAKDRQEFDQLKRIAAAAKWQCLFDEWRGDRHSYRFRCDRGHEFFRSARTLLDSKRARACGMCYEDDLSDRFRQTVAAREGVLLNKGLADKNKRYRLRCRAGHEWEASRREIVDGRWCPQCPNVVVTGRMVREGAQYALSRLQSAARKQGGRCLAKEYTVLEAEYPFECAIGHRWVADGRGIIRGEWCPQCTCQRSRLGCSRLRALERLQEAARKLGGVCLSDVYLTAIARYRFRCALGHEWSTTATIIFRGHWCAMCAKLKQRKTIADMEKLADGKGGHCLSTEYRGTYVALTWQCRAGHIFEKQPAHVRQGLWCTTCVQQHRIRTKDNASR